MIEEADATFQEVFTQLRSADSNMLLSWYVSSVVPIYYTNNVLDTAMQQEEDVSATITVPKLKAHQLWAPQTVQLIQLEICICQYLPYWISLLLALPQWGAHLRSSLPFPPRKSGTTLPAAQLVIIMAKGPMSTPKRLRLGVNTALHRVTWTSPNWYWRPDQL